MIEDAVIVADDFIERRAVNGGHDQSGPLRLAIGRGKLGKGLPVHSQRAFDLECHELAKAFAVARLQQIGFSDAEA